MKMATDRKNKVSKPVSKPKGQRAGGTKDADTISNWRVVKVCVGMAVLVAALFLIASFSSYVAAGQTDFSYGEAVTGAELLKNRPVSNIGGHVGVLCSYFFINECFGLASYFIPVFLIIVGLWLIGSFRFSIFKDFVKLALLMVWLSIVLAVVGTWIPGADTLHFGLGGNHGEHIHVLLTNLVGDVGELALIGLSIVFVLIYFSVKTVDRITEFFRFRKLREMKERIGDRLKKEGIADEQSEADQSSPSAEDEDSSAGENENPDEETGVTVPESAAVTLEFTEDDLRQDKHTENHDVPVTSSADEDGENHEDKADVASMFDRVVAAQGGQQPAGTTSAAGSAAEGAEPGFIIETNETEQGTGKIARGDALTPYDPRLELAHYKFPPLSLLDKNEANTPSVDIQEQQGNKDRIIHVLKSFGVEISSIRATIGPTITLYEITPAEGMRISKIRNLEDDIALSLAAEGIRIIAPIPGKGTIGIEVPNKKKCIVSMESVLSSRTYQESKMELPCALGKTITNEVFMVDLAKAPHMLVAGATGMGKSVGLNAIITSLLYKKHPSELKMVMVDPKKVEFSVYAPIANQYLAKLEDEEDAIITDNQRVVKTLNALCKLMDDRYGLLKKAHVRNIKEYNKEFKARKLNPNEGHAYMPYYVVIIDEFGDLIMTAGKEIELPICRIAQLARAVGIHMIIATQRPTTKIITGTIKANFPARIAFKVAAMMDSRIILDRPGANQLIGKGDMLYLQSADPVRVQCAFVDTPEVKRICQFISEQQKYPEMTYLPEPPLDDSGSDGAGEVDTKHLDSMFAEVAQMVVSQQQGSTSAIQRKFSIGYNRAGRLMDQLEKTGVVGPQIGSKPREVLIQDLLTLDSLLSSLGLS